MWLWSSIAAASVALHPPAARVLEVADCLRRDPAAEPTVVQDPQLPPQGYRLELQAERTVVVASDAAAERYARDTLAQLAGHSGCLIIEDAPAIARRWVHVQLPGRSTGGVPLFERQKATLGALRSYSSTADYLPLLDHLLDSVVAARLNGIVLELNGMWVLPSHPELALPWAISIERLRPWLDRAEAHGVDVIPLLPLFSHQEQLLAPAYPELMRVPMARFPKKRGRPPDPTFWWNPISDPRRPKVQELHADLLGDVIRVFEPDLVHVGHDEAGALRFTDASEAPEVFAHSVQSAHALVRQAGAHLAIWADMLLDGWRIQGTAHGNEAGTPTWKALTELPDDVVLMDWQYHGTPRTWPERGVLDDVPSLRYLAASGHPVMGTALGRPLDRVPVPKNRMPQVEQSARIARTLVDLQASGAQTYGHLTAHFSLTPGRLAPWPDTSIAGSVHVAGLHGWTGGTKAHVWPSKPDWQGPQ